MFLSFLAMWGREARTSFEGGTLSLAGVLAAHKIMASSPDMDQATVSALRVGARWKQIGSLGLSVHHTRLRARVESSCTVAPTPVGKQTCHEDPASLACHEYSW